MAKNKENETILQQRKAREEFLKLKQMQNGEIAPPPKPSEQAVLPSTLKEKLQNFWYHFKWHTIAFVSLVVVLAVTLTQCMNRTDWDMQVVYFTYSPVLDSTLEPIADYFEALTQDINGDGEVNVGIINCSVSSDISDVQTEQAKLIKLQSVIASEHEAILFITDKDAMAYFSNANFKNLFEQAPLPLNEEFYNAVKSAGLPEGLQISCRRVDNTLIDNKDAQNVYKQAQKLLEKLK